MESYSHKKLISCLVCIVFILVIAIIFASIPPTFPGRTIVSVPEGSTLSQTARLLKDNHIIRSQFLYKAFVVILGDSTHVIKGDYLFDQPQSIIRVAYRTVNGIQGLTKIKITIPEGSDSSAVIAILKKNILSFDDVSFLSLARANEGYLFPETYFFYENVTPEAVIAAMRAVFDQKIAAIQAKLADFGKTLDDVITMSSIVEKEASTSADRQIIAGILWRRLRDGMPLQVDPPFLYLIGKGTSDLTSADLATDSPYNLYKNKGLTPTPIDNPGLEAILDTITPTTTKYWYYLSDKDGVTHYATTFEAHVENKAKYLR